MDSISALSINLSCGLACLVFLLAVMGKFFAQRRSNAPLPPPLPQGKVLVWPYQMGDAFGFLVIFSLFFLLILGATFSDRKNEEFEIEYVDIVFSIGFQIFMAALVSMFMFQRIRLSEWLGLKWKGWGKVFWIAPLAVFSMWMLMAVCFGLGYMEFVEGLGVETVQETVEFFQVETDPFLLALMAFTAVIVAPVCEEVVFRGYLYPVAKWFGGPWLGAFVSALFFSAIHGNLGVLLPLFFFGIILAMLYEKTGSIWAPIGAHLLFNLATVSAQFLIRMADLGHLIEP